MSNVTVLGLGAMGSRMAANLIASGHLVTVWNKSPGKARSLIDKGALLAATPRDAVVHADFVISVISDDAASRSVWLDSETGALAGAKRAAILIESSTLSGAWIRELGEIISDKGFSFLDACVSGSRPQVESHQLVYFVGGSVTDLQAATPVLTAAGGAHIHHVGEVGSGTAVKLATNVLLGVQTAAMAEALTLLKRVNVDALQALEAIGSTFVCSPFAKGVGTLMAKQSFSPLFTSKLVAKDMRYALAAAEGDFMPLISATHEVFQAAVERGWAEENLSSVIKLYE
ncbi:3-hydroxyisobutyrate dehydrogenase-like beta-hydroxyacid dehydrogenase [Pseudomonas sp. JUb42]|jgi:3-hydroxyisobutyrate dehydrogenase-like beta-hydroxyacid dehydrogenase|uniref:NAD(P)-dependent oxidoreductase n=1 Tax=Pseudomonas sp. JUb42 TaxID=2940611 RepID=UPI002167CA26|nr:NAD(P)-dependent oxidoreductase [Pseudomonas sp. JUb42]MCS3468907.1 3-hydroxyisobutyrate dehydrogenase-like beta-hydroxyacid dehydrogenase [Pseudomonas sp. JUb42]